MKAAIFCLVVLAATAMALPLDPAVSEAALAIQSRSDLLTEGNGLYRPVRVDRPVYRYVYTVPRREYEELPVQDEFVTRLILKSRAGDILLPSLTRGV